MANVLYQIFILIHNFFLTQNNYLCCTQKKNTISSLKITFVIASCDHYYNQSVYFVKYVDCPLIYQLYKSTIKKNILGR